MKILGSFVGINKYLSPDINELTSATRDARALWALFSDTFTEIQSELLLDEVATSESIRTSIAKTLEAADAEDVAIVSFSGHGTRSHRLVAYDTVRAQLDQTTIPMEFLAEAFKKSKAKVIILVLDCCFSGGAPAKVFEDSPTPRDLDDPYQLLQGKGRILIAASNATQSAYERPGIGHGLLTEAFIRVLKNGAGQIDVTAAVFQIMDIVQAEAGRIGVTQTPVVLSLIEGGLLLPVLREGPKFLSLFPPDRSVQVSKEISDLAQFHLPEIIITEWAQRFPNGLNALQLKAVNEHKVLSGDSLLVVAPTSSGKTFVGEMAAVKAVTTGRKAVFLLPYRALVNEKYQDFSAIYGSKIGMSVIRCTGDYSDQATSFVRGKFDLAVLTFEMFLNLIVSTPSVLNQIGLVVLDEAQFVTDPSRGITIELLLTALMSARSRGIAPQIVALSAVIGDANRFDSWLGLRLLLTRERPIPLIEGVMDRSGKYQFLDVDGTVKDIQLVPSRSIQQRKDKPSAQDVIVPLTSQLVGNGEKLLVFRNQRGSAQGCAAYLATDLRLSPATEAIQNLPNLDQSSTSQALRKCLAGGTAFHTSNLSREEREVIENVFRRPDGPIKVLAATTTVAAGINTPASTVVIAEQEFIGEDGRAFTVAEYKNMAGRAGRLGYSETGKSIILAENSIQKSQLFQKYVMGRIEKMTSSFDLKDINTWVVRLLAQVKSVPHDDIVRLLVNTYGGYLATVIDASWPQKTGTQITGLITRMLSLGLLEQEGKQIQLTLLGRACGNSSLTFESSLRLVELLREFSSWQLTGQALVGLVQILQESDDTWTPLYRKGAGEPKRIQQAAARYGNQIVGALQKFAGSQYVYQARAKRAAVLFDWMRGVPLGNIETEFSHNPYQGAIQAGDIRRFADSTRFHLRSAYQIALVVAPQGLCADDQFDALQRRLEVGLPLEGLGLLKLRANLNRGEYLSLLAHNIRSDGDVLSTPEDRLVQILGETRAKQLASHKSVVQANIATPVTS